MSADKLDVPCLDDLKNSSLVLHGRSTSTPIGENRLSFSFLNSSIATPKMNISAVTIFGRRNLQLLDQYPESDNNPPEVATIAKKPKVRQHIANVDKTFDDRVQPSSSGLKAIKEDTQETKRKMMRKRRSVHNESRGPIFKVAPKTPKSPRLLTAIRAKIKVSREKARCVDSEIFKANQKNSLEKKENCVRPLRKTAPVFNKYKITIPTSPKLGKTKKPCKI